MCFECGVCLVVMGKVRRKGGNHDDGGLVVVIGGGDSSKVAVEGYGDDHRDEGVVVEVVVVAGKVRCSYYRWDHGRCVNGGRKNVMISMTK